ncbi:hypothetical protein M758_3G110300 [Ceratodon purpureus]|nr:hypothetical protein M758_3G110300 [Ceratodon purpureus]
MALNRDKKNALVTVAALLAIVAFVQIVGYGRVTHSSAGAPNHIWQRNSATPGPEGRACISHICVFFDVMFADELAGRIIFLLYEKKAPKTVENFRSLATGERGINEKGIILHYKNTTFDRVVHGLLVQGGDIMRGKGKEGEIASIYGGKFRSETDDAKFDQKGLLAMESMGPHKQGSVFFITVDAIPELDGQYVVFGEVIEGMEVVERINNSVFAEDESPRMRIVISDSGQL